MEYEVELCTNCYWKVAISSEEPRKMLWDSEGDSVKVSVVLVVFGGVWLVQKSLEKFHGRIIFKLKMLSADFCDDNFDFNDDNTKTEVKSVLRVN